MLVDAETDDLQAMTCVSDSCQRRLQHAVAFCPYCGAAQQDPPEAVEPPAAEPETPPPVVDEPQPEIRQPAPPPPPAAEAIEWGDDFYGSPTSRKKPPSRLKPWQIFGLGLLAIVVLVTLTRKPDSAPEPSASAVPEVSSRVITATPNAWTRIQRGEGQVKLSAPVAFHVRLGGEVYLARPGSPLTLPGVADPEVRTITGATQVTITTTRP